MSSYVPAALRRFVAERAAGICEYCLPHENDAFFRFQVEHVISEKHGGATVPQNLAYACILCNRLKGSDVGSIVPSTGAFCRFFNPRTDRWPDHFLLEGAAIRPHTDVGTVTARILGLNDAARVAEREALRVVGRFPPPGAPIR